MATNPRDFAEISGKGLSLKIKDKKDLNAADIDSEGFELVKSKRDRRNIKKQLVIPQKKLNRREYADKRIGNKTSKGKKSASNNFSSYVKAGKAYIPTLNVHSSISVVCCAPFVEREEDVGDDNKIETSVVEYSMKSERDFPNLTKDFGVALDSLVEERSDDELVEDINDFLRSESVHPDKFKRSGSYAFVAGRRFGSSDEFPELQAGEPVQQKPEEVKPIDWLRWADAVIAIVPLVSGGLHSSGLSDVLLFLRGLAGATDEASVRLSFLNLVNCCQSRFGSGLFCDSVMNILDTEVLSLFKDGVSLEEVSLQVEGQDKEFADFSSVLAEKYKEYFLKPLEKKTSIEDFVPEEKVKMVIDALPLFFRSKLYDKLMMVVKLITTYYALISFFDKKQVEDMMKSIRETSWFKGIKIVGTGSLLIYGILTVYTEASAVWARFLGNEPLFGIDPLLKLTQLVQDLELKVGVSESETDFTVAAVRKRLHDLNEELTLVTTKVEDAVANSISFKREEINIVANLHRKVKELKLKLLNHFCEASKVRSEPFSLTLRGPPGIGKSALLCVFHEVFARELGYPSSPAWMYMINSASKYDDTFKPGMWNVVFDDYGAANPEKSQNAAESIVKPIAVVNTIPCPAVKADVTEKGKMWLTPEVVIFTVNKPEIAVKAVMIEPMAIFRRMGIIICPELRETWGMKDNKELLDYRKYAGNCARGDFPDGHPWFFKIGRYVSREKEVKLAYTVNPEPCCGKGFSNEYYTFPQMMNYVLNELRIRSKSSIEKVFFNDTTCIICDLPLHLHDKVCPGPRPFIGPDSMIGPLSRELADTISLIETDLTVRIGAVTEDAVVNIGSMQHVSDANQTVIVTQAGNSSEGFTFSKNLKETLAKVMCSEEYKEFMPKVDRFFEGKKIYVDRIRDVTDKVIPIVVSQRTRLFERVKNYYNILTGTKTIMSLTKSEAAQWICALYLLDLAEMLHTGKIAAFVGWLMFSYLVSYSALTWFVFLLCFCGEIVFVLAHKTSFHYLDRVLMKKTCLDVILGYHDGKFTIWDSLRLTHPGQFQKVEMTVKSVGVLALAVSVYKGSSCIWGFLSRKGDNIQVATPEFKGTEAPEEFKAAKPNLGKRPVGYTETFGLCLAESNLLAEQEEKKRNVWRSPLYAGAAATCGLFAIKSLYPRPVLQDLIKRMSVIVEVVGMDMVPKFTRCFSGYLYKEILVIPRHGLEYWKDLRLFAEGRIEMKVTSLAGSGSRPNFNMRVSDEDFVLDVFDFAAIRVSDYWGRLPDKCSDLYWDAPEDFCPNLVGFSGEVFVPRRDKFVNVKFVHSTQPLAILNPFMNGFITKKYKNENNVALIDYRPVDGGESFLNGDCHSLIVANIDGKSMIVGVHTQMAVNQITSLVTYSGYVISTKMLDRLHEACLKKSGSVPYEPKTSLQIAGDIHPKCRLNTLPEILKIQIVGKTVSNYRVHPKSVVQKTLIADSFEDDLLKAGGNFGPPIMEAFKTEEGNWVDPHDKMLQGFSDKFKPLDMDLFKFCIDDYAEPFKNLGVVKRRPLTLCEAINGTLDGRIIAMNLKTSAGIMYTGKKEKYVEVDSDATSVYGRPCWKLLPEVFEDFNARLTAIKEGNYYSFNVRTQLKDEVREVGKPARVFYLGDFVDYLIQKIYYAEIVEIFRRHRDVSENMIGLNCASSEWKEVFESLNSYNNTGDDGDFSNFDLLQKRVLMLCIVDYCYKPLGGLLGYTVEDLNCVKIIGVAEAFTFVEMGGDVFLPDGFRPSGGFMTSDGNCVMNSVLHRYAFYYTLRDYRELYIIKFSPERTKTYFRDCVKLKVFGDDSLQAIKPWPMKWYNFTTIKECLGKYGIKVTPAVKGGGDYITKPFSELRFLKRAFRQATVEVDGALKEFVLAPLELSSILKPLVWQVKSKEVTSAAQTASAIVSVNRELWMYGREFMDNYRERLQDAMNELGVEDNLETYDDISRQYCEGSYCTMDT